MYRCIQYDGKGFIDYTYVDLNGEPVEKTKEQYPYSYDTYVVWKGNYKKGEGNTVYSDRLFQWDWEKYNRCCEEVWGNKGQYFDNRTPKDIEKFLRLYTDKQIKLTAILEGCNWSTGYPVWIFIYEN
jgi:hypothetical protein